MKHLTKLTALLLCLSLLLGMTACGAKPVETEPPTAAPTEPPTEAPTEPPAAELYAAAYEAARGQQDFTMKITSTRTTLVADESYIQSSNQIISYSGFGTENMKYSSTEDLDYTGVVYYTYDETYADGMLYVTEDQAYHFSGEITPEEAAARYLNPLMLDPALYGTITTGMTGSILLKDPTAAESWAMPEGAEFLEASGEATIGTDGLPERLSYTISYQYGAAEITLEVRANLTFGSTTIEVPSDADSYIPLQDVDSVYLAMNICGMLFQAPTVTVTSLESVTSQAAAVVRNVSTGLDYYYGSKGLNAKVDTSIYMMDYSTNQDQRYEQEEVYINGKYTFSADGSEPETQAGVSDAIMDDYAIGIMGSHIIVSEYWTDAAITDLGSTLLIELSFNENFGDAIEGNICNTFWGDSQFLRNLSSAYACNEVSGYLAVDKYTGLPTAAGYYYEGSHTIDGQPYLLSLQSDQSITAPATAAYQNITEEMLPEEAPETQAAPLFYHVTGENGQEMWLLGTIHVGDERTGYLPQEIYDAFAASDALALEIDSETFEEQSEEDEALQAELSAAYYYSDGSTAKDRLDQEVYDAAVRYMKASGNYNMNTPYLKLSMWSNSIENFYLRQGYALTGEQGVEERLTKMAKDQGKEIREVESGLFQIKMLTGWSEELQKILLEDSLAVDADEYIADVQHLYELWCAGDEAALREELSDEVDTSELTEEELAEYESVKHLYDEYNKAMSYDRNEGMLKAAIGYLESGDVVFYAVGLAHLLNNVNGLVDALRAAGYTVEQVSYAS